MRIHSDLSATHLINAVHAANVPGVAIMKIEKRGSRSRKHRFDISLSGHSITGGAYGNVEYQTATWDEWGMAIEQIFKADPKAIVGPYKTHTLFVQITMDRYSDLTVDEMCLRHRWTPLGNFRFTCHRCGAEMHNIIARDRYYADVEKRRAERAAHVAVSA